MPHQSMAVAPPLLVRVLGRCLYNMILVGLCTHATLLKAYFVALFGIVIVLCGQTQPTKGWVWSHETI